MRSCPWIPANLCGRGGSGGRLLTFLDFRVFFSSSIAYFRRSRAPFERIIELNGDPIEVIKKEGGKDRARVWCDIAATAHRLLRTAPRIFSELWNWSPFYTLLHHPDQLVRWHAAEAVTLLLHMNDTTKAEFLSQTLGFSPDFLVTTRFPP